MMRVVLATVKTGKVLGEIAALDESDFLRDVNAQDRATIVIPLAEIPEEHRANLGGYLRKNTRKLVLLDDDNNVLGGGPIEHFTPDNDTSKVSVSVLGWGMWMERLVVLRKEDRKGISNQNAEWTVTGTPAEVINEVFTKVTEDDENFSFPQCFRFPTGGTGSITHTFKLAELTTIKDFTDSLASSYEGFETIYEGRYVEGDEPLVVWDIVAGEPHYNKELPPLNLNIDEKGKGVTAFSYTENGAEEYNWLLMRSQATKSDDANWIDLESRHLARPSDDEHLTLFKKEFFNVPLTPEEINSQFVARLETANVTMKTYSISVFDAGFFFLDKLGRRLHVQATKRLTGLNEEMRITGISWNKNDPSSVSLTVQPAALRVYPRLPTRLTDAIKETAKEAAVNPWQNSNPGTGGGGDIPGLPNDWDQPDHSLKPKESELMESPVEQIFEFWNRDSVKAKWNENLQHTEPLWGEHGWNLNGNDTYGNIGPAAETVIENHYQSRYYGMGWLAQVTMHDKIEARITPKEVEVFSSRKFVRRPDFTQSGNVITDEALGVEGSGLLCGTLSAEKILEQMLPAESKGVLKWERLATGSFFTGPLESQVFVLYLHQLQIFDNDKTVIKSKGMAWEIDVDAETGVFKGDWRVTDYPFSLPSHSKTFYPMPAQVATHGPNKAFISCVTPAAYLADRELNVSYPLLVSNSFWKQLNQGRYAIEDTTITKNYETGEVFQTPGMNIEIAQSKELRDDDAKKWAESFQLIFHKGDLYATNMTSQSYDTKTDSKGGDRYFMRFAMRTTADQNGKPGDWFGLASQYELRNYPSIGGAERGQMLQTSSLMGIGEYIFMGNTDGKKEELPADVGSTYLVITAKVGTNSTKISYGWMEVPGDWNGTFWYRYSSSGASPGPFVFYPDFYHFSLFEHPERALSNTAEETWAQRGDYIFPIWNGYNSHKLPSFNFLTVDNWSVQYAPTESYLLKNRGDAGLTGAWRWWKEKDSQ